jgi:predicted transcriptional regulator
MDFVRLTFKSPDGKTRHIERIVYGWNVAYALAGAVDEAMREYGIKQNSNIRYEIKHE